MLVCVWVWHGGVPQRTATHACCVLVYACPLFSQQTSPHIHSHSRQTEQQRATTMNKQRQPQQGAAAAAAASHSFAASATPAAAAQHSISRQQGAAASAGSGVPEVKRVCLYKDQGCPKDFIRSRAGDQAKSKHQLLQCKYRPPLDSLYVPSRRPDSHSAHAAAADAAEVDGGGFDGGGFDGDWQEEEEKTLGGRVEADLDDCIEEEKEEDFFRFVTEAASEAGAEWLR